MMRSLRRWLSERLIGPPAAKGSMREPNLMSHHRMLPPRYALIALGSGLLLVSASAKSAAFSPQLRALGAAGALAAGLACCIVAVVVTPVPRAWRRLYARIYVVAGASGLTPLPLGLGVWLAATLF